MAFTIKVKGEVEEGKTSKQTVSFLVPVPVPKWADDGEPMASEVIDIENSWGEKMCKFQLRITYLEYADYTGYHDELGVILSTEDPVQMNATVSAVLLLPDGTPSEDTNEMGEIACGKLKCSSSPEKAKLQLGVPFGIGGKKKLKTYAQRRTDSEDTRDPDHDDHLVIQFTMSIEYMYPPIPKKPLFIKRYSKRAAWERNNQVARVRLASSPVFEKVKLICSDGEEINVNKDLLTTFCPVFEAMFRSNMQEAETKVIKVSDVKGSVMQILLDHWFEAKLAESWSKPDVIGDLALAADKYGVVPMMELLDKALGKESVVASSLQLLEIAEKAGYKKAEKSIVENLVRRANSERTRDTFYAAFGVDTTVIKDRLKGESQSEILELRRVFRDMGPGWNSENSTHECLNRVADLGLIEQEKIILVHLNKRLRLVENRQELLEAIGLSHAVPTEEPAKKKIRLENANE